MDFTTQLGNNEQRKVSASDSTLLAIMPGGQSLPLGEQHIIGRIPKNSIVTGFQAIAQGLSSDIVVSFGYTDNPVLFLDNATLVDGETAVNDQYSAMQHYFPDGADLVLTIHSGGFNTPNSILQTSVMVTELETKLGKYTA